VSIIHVAPAEPSFFYQLGPRTTEYEKEYGVDFFSLLPTGKSGIQRKAFPSDFFASLRDGRLQKEIWQMQKLENRLILLEGRPQFTTTGALLDPRIKATRNTIAGLLLSIQITHRIPVLWTDDHQSTLEAVLAFFAWCSKSAHDGLARRPGPGNEADREAWQLHFLQGVPGVGVIHGERILKHFGRLPFDLIEGAKYGRLASIERIGPVLAQNFEDFFK
jgi:ERCC4-type nuclease